MTFKEKALRGLVFVACALVATFGATWSLRKIGGSPSFPFAETTAVTKQSQASQPRFIKARATTTSVLQLTQDRAIREHPLYLELIGLDLPSIRHHLRSKTEWLKMATKDRYILLSARADDLITNANSHPIIPLRRAAPLAAIADTLGRDKIQSITLDFTETQDPQFQRLQRFVLDLFPDQELTLRKRNPESPMRLTLAFYADETRNLIR